MLLYLNRAKTWSPLLHDSRANVIATSMMMRKIIKGFDCFDLSCIEVFGVLILDLKAMNHMSPFC